MILLILLNLSPSATFNNSKSTISVLVRYAPARLILSRPISLLVSDLDETQSLCGPEIKVIEFKIDDGWLRDSGPTFVINKT